MQSTIDENYTVSQLLQNSADFIRKIEDSNVFDVVLKEGDVEIYFNKEKVGELRLNSSEDVPMYYSVGSNYGERVSAIEQLALDFDILVSGKTL